MSRASETDTESILSATKTPRRDLVRYAGVYPLAVVCVAVLASLHSVIAMSYALIGLACVMLASAVAAWWVTRTGKVGSASGFGDEPSYGVTHVLTDDAQQRLRIVLFTAGILLSGTIGIAGILWLYVNVDGIPLY